MKKISIRIAGVAIAFLILGGCAHIEKMSSFERTATCVAVGATAGGAAGGTESGRNAVKGAIGGALVGALVCNLLDTDDDNDGIGNGIDECPQTPAGATVDDRGCTSAKVVQQPKPVRKKVVQKDDDGDGVVNRDDLCPGTPKGVKVDKSGCPEKQTVVLKGVNFLFDSAVLTNQAKSKLAGQAAVLKKNPAVKISITGHTDSRGAAAYNQKLSLERARSVKNYLVSEGISGRKITVSGAGESAPVASNATDAGRAKNRRVELDIIRKSK